MHFSITLMSSSYSTVLLISLYVKTPNSAETSFKFFTIFKDPLPSS